MLPSSLDSMSLHLTLTGLSDIGLIRRRNEDSFALAAESGIAVVADGMGGHPGGDVASRAASSAALEELSRLRSAPTTQSSAPPLDLAMSRAVLMAHAAVRDRSAQDAALSGMGTTLTALAATAENGIWVIGHAGDSRAYLLRHGSFRQLTRDDTWVQQRVDAAELTPAQARRHPFGHILTQCLGLEEPPEPQVLTGCLQPGDLFLLCTDGLAGMLENEVIADALRAHTQGAARAADLEGAARALVEMARDRGGYDNITVALVAVS